MQNQTEIPDKWPDKWLEILTCTLLDCYICDKKNKEKQRKASKKKANERYQDLPEKNKIKTKSDNLVTDDMKSFLKIKNNGLLSIVNNISPKRIKRHQYGLINAFSF